MASAAIIQIVVLLLGLRVFLCNEISCDYSLLKGSAEFCVDGVCDVAEGSVGISSAWHYYEQLFFSVDYFDIMERKLVVEGNRCNGFHWTLVIERFSDFDVCDLHLELPLIYCLVYS